MGYQALLFCHDARLARVVTQVFNELDFNVEAVNEPFAAVKKLMAQRYDAIVVDCENEPNASLLFKSARNSTSNQNSLALALVEGQAGVAKAYRIGANLVLTKPINVEQAKGTLRVARGLLRKNVDAAAGATPGSMGASKQAPSAFKPAATAGIPARNIYESPEFDSPEPAPTAFAGIEESPAAAELFEVAASVSETAPVTNVVQQPAFAPEPARPPNAVTPPAREFSPTSSPSFQGSAAAPAPAKEATPAPVEKKLVVAPPVESSVSSSPTFGAGSSPTFAALDVEDSDGSGGSKKILLAAAVVLAVAVLGYFGWTKLAGSGSSHGSAPQAPVSLPSATSLPSPSASEPAASTTLPSTAPASKPSATISAPSANKIFVDTEPVASKPTPPPIVVKSSPAAKKVPAQADDVAPQVPNPLAVASPNDKSLNGLVSSVPSQMPKAVPTTLKISQGVSQGLLIKRVQPRYPQNALSMRIQGTVQLDALIDKEGSITNLKVLSGDPGLARAATEAVRQWRYKPYYLNGEPVEIQTQITVNFKLPN